MLALVAFGVVVAATSTAQAQERDGARTRVAARHGAVRTAPLRPLASGRQSTVSWASLHSLASRAARLSHRPAANAARKPSASVGEGGRDLATRLAVPLGRSYGTFGGVEFHAGAGDAPALLGPTAQHLRLQPIVVLGMSPAAGVDVFAGAGAGAATVWARPAAGGLVDQQSSGPQSTGAALAGVRLDTPVAPMVLQLRADAVSQHGTAAAATMAFELGS